jgi:hypothetical protein
VLYLQDTDLSKVKEVTIVNASGVTAYKTSMVSSNGIRISQLSSGIYLVKITRKDGIATSHKIVVSK